MTTLPGFAKTGAVCGGNDPSKGCRKPILWGEDEAGRRIPLDPSAPVYRIVRHDAGGTPIIRREKDAMVSHFKTCPKASEFSGGRK